MNQTRKMWASAAVVGVIIVGGASVAVSASAGRLEQVRGETRAVVEKGSPSSAPEPTDDIVVSKEVNPDPAKVVEYWTDKRMEDAQPMPMPEVGQSEFEVAE